MKLRGLLFVILEWFLVGDRMECDGSNNALGSIPTIEECASNCNGQASMFAYGTNDYGTSRCDSGGCKCLCETAASTEGTCTEINHNGYRLYKYKSAGNIMFIVNFHNFNDLLTKNNFTFEIFSLKLFSYF